MAQVTDPVCGMNIDSDHAAATEHHGDHVHYFCSTACARAFHEAPERYHSARGRAGSDEPRDRMPPRTVEDGIASPMFGSAGSGGAEFEPIPEEDEEPKS